ncbi:hypothetical protein MTR_8g076430 [Medicago truncatula]|uniref:RNase H type-1 domain-containing protein n=1 Tax=Medicago truncatula TaxID=3880 RepID=G7LD18_MEDTR|nr:hypothetical protein MTR_8g076430 [Medicago truncatula]
MTTKDKYQDEGSFDVGGLTNQPNSSFHYYPSGWCIFSDGASSEVLGKAFVELEIDSKLVVLAISSINAVLWDLRNRWLDSMHLIRNMNFVVSHILREGNYCVDKMTNQRSNFNLVG